MGKYIDAESLLDIINEYIEEYSEMQNGYHDPKWCAMQEVKMAINNQPFFDDIEPKQRWIPCSERVPGEKGAYLCTEDFLGDISVNVSYFDGERWCLLNGIPHFATIVVAWMPLSEPYMGGKQE